MVGVEDTVAQKVLAQELPDILDGVQLRRVGREMEQAEIGWHHKPPAQFVPPRAVERDHRMGTRCHQRADLRQMQVHCQGVGLWQHQARPDATGGTDRAE